MSVTNFVDFCRENNLPLPATMENTKRSGIRGQYPDGYVRSQYPDGYFSPISATAFLDLKNADKIKHKKDAGNTPL
jgi:hypothetical protein